MIEKVENKINLWKRKVSPKFFGVFLFMLFTAMTMFGMEMLNLFKRQKQEVQDEYNKSMYQIVSYVNNVEVELEKLQLTTTSQLKISTLADIWRQSNLAKTNLEALPVSQDSMQNASKYLTQLSDFSYHLMRQLILGKEMEQKEYDNIKNLTKKAIEFSKVLSEIYYDLNNGKIKWDELSKIGNEKLQQVDISQEVANIDKINKTFQTYEGLIYDGAFSDHILAIEPKFLGKDIVDESTARNKIYSIFDEKQIDKITYLGETSGKIDLYEYEVKLKEKEEIQVVYITKNDARLYLMLGDRKVNEDVISMEEAKEKGIEFLKKLGIENMADTYYLKSENIATINYAALQDGVILYPDLIKVKIALDTGEILSMEAQGYIFNHITREEVTPQISIEEARKINPDIQILSERLAIIPTESKLEILTYEFKGKIEEREFIVYINAQTGIEEKILLILDTPGGILTM